MNNSLGGRRKDHLREIVPRRAYGVHSSNTGIAATLTEADVLRTVPAITDVKPDYVCDEQKTSRDTLSSINSLITDIRRACRRYHGQGMPMEHGVCTTAWHCRQGMGEELSSCHSRILSGRYWRSRAGLGCSPLACHPTTLTMFLRAFTRLVPEKDDRCA